jgi:hypothetical protein
MDEARRIAANIAKLSELLSNEAVNGWPPSPSVAWTDSIKSGFLLFSLDGQSKRWRDDTAGGCRLQLGKKTAMDP